MTAYTDLLAQFPETIDSMSLVSIDFLRLDATAGPFADVGLSFGSDADALEFLAGRLAARLDEDQSGFHERGDLDADRNWLLTLARGAREAAARLATDEIIGMLREDAPILFEDERAERDAMYGDAAPAVRDILDAIDLDSIKRANAAAARVRAKREAAPKRRIVVIGPNLPRGANPDGGAFVAHREGCRDAARLLRQLGETADWVIEAATYAEVGHAIYDDHIDEGSMTIEDAIQDIHFLPCCGLDH